MCRVCRINRYRPAWADPLHVLDRGDGFLRIALASGGLDHLVDHARAVIGRHRGHRHIVGGCANLCEPLEECLVLGRRMGHCVMIGRLNAQSVCRRCLADPVRLRRPPVEISLTPPDFRPLSIYAFTKPSVGGPAGRNVKIVSAPEPLDALHDRAEVRGVQRHPDRFDDRPAV